MVQSYTSSILLLFIISTALAAICPERHYLNAQLQRCMNCTECTDGMVVLIPCQLHRDTYCGSMSTLLGTNTHHPHRHHHHEKNRHEKHRNQGDDNGGYRHDIQEEVASSEAPFSGTETLIWDWQAIALTSAVFACILFFLVIALYSLHQARQWRRLKENFEADVEELSARLSLMAATSTERCEFLDGGESGTGFIMGNTPTGGDPNYLNTRCVYLEQLLSVRQEDEKNRKSKPKGNVYIEENKPKK